MYYELLVPCPLSPYPIMINDIHNGVSPCPTPL